VEKTLRHEGDSVREFYSALTGPTRVGIEATGSMPWFLELMEELGIDCQVGHLYRHLEAQIEDLNRKVEELAWQRPQARRLMTHPGVGPITALATETFLGEPKRFVDGKAVASYVGLIPSEHSSGGRQRLGGLSKQGNPLLRDSQGCGLAAFFPAQAGAERSGEGESGRRTKVGNPTLDPAA
ncbi:MAG TPA: transposase, partial [Terriglobales bacterium]|nr:transposase [Terriglobales bacterium]